MGAISVEPLHSLTGRGKSIRKYMSASYAERFEHKNCERGYRPT